MPFSGSEWLAASFRNGRRQIWWQRIGFRLTLLVLLVCTLPPLTLGILAMRSARVAQEREIREQHAMLAAWGVDKVRGYLEGITEDMKLVIQLCDLQAMDLATARPYLAYLLNFIEDVKEISLIDDRGQERIKLAENLLVTDEDLQSQASASKFLVPMRGEQYISPLRTSAFSEPFVSVALPIRRLEEDRVVGVLTAEINLKRLWDEMLSFKVGQSGYLYLVNGEGRLIAHPDFSLVLSRHDVSKVGAVRRFLEGLDDRAPGPNPEYLNYRGVPVVGVQARIPKLGWGVIVEQPTAEAFSSVNRMKIETTLILVNAIAVTLVLAFIAAQNLTKPLAELAQGTRMLGAGNFAHRIPVRSGDEIGEVAEHFNAMAEQLRGSFERLQSLLETSRATSSSLELEEVLAAALEQMDRLSGAGQSGILLLEGRLRNTEAVSTTVRTRGAGSAVRTLALPPEGFAHLWQVLHTGRAVPVEDVAATADTGERALWGPQELGAIMLLPLLAKGQVLGALWMGRNAPGPFSSQEVALAQTLANHVAIAIDNARLYDALRRTSEELELRVEARTRELREANEELVRSERLALIGQLAGGVGHELRNPLGAIGNAVYYLRMRLKDGEDPKIQKHLGILETEVRRSNKIVTDLMDFARVKPPTRAQIELAGIVRDVLARQPEDSRIQRVVELGDPGLVEVDGDQVGQVVLNVVMNAVEAMPAGGTLTIRLASTPDGVLCSIGDTGIGIPPENLEKIFQPLFTTKARGIGLGLAVCRRLAEANGGSLKVESRVGSGSTFTLTFPLPHAGDGNG